MCNYKICKTCKQNKNWNEFYLNPYNKRPLAHCKRCFINIRKTYRDKNITKIKEYETSQYWKHRNKKLNKYKKWAKNNRPYLRSYDLNYSRSFTGKMRKMYLSILSRTTPTSVRYTGRILTFTREEFLNWIQLNIELYTKLYKTWKNSNFNRRYSPSVDRIDNSKGYELNNIQLMFQYQNAGKDNRPSKQIPTRSK